GPPPYPAGGRKSARAAGGNRGNRVWGVGQAFFQCFSWSAPSSSPGSHGSRAKRAHFPPGIPHTSSGGSREGGGACGAFAGHWEPGPKIALTSCPAKDLQGSRAVGTCGNRREPPGRIDGYGLVYRLGRPVSAVGPRRLAVAGRGPGPANVRRGRRAL